MRTPSHPFVDPRAEAARTIVARGLAQRWTADDVVRELACERLLAEGLNVSTKDLETWRA